MMATASEGSQTDSLSYLPQSHSQATLGAELFLHGPGRWFLINLQSDCNLLSGKKQGQTLKLWIFCSSDFLDCAIINPCKMVTADFCPGFVFHHARDYHFHEIFEKIG